MVSERLIEKARAEHLVITLGAEGLLITATEDGRRVTDRLPAFNILPKDVSGAGDSFFMSSAMALRVGADIWQSAYLGALAAALQVSRVGNTPLTVADFVMEIDDDRPQLTIEGRDDARAAPRRGARQPVAAVDRDHAEMPRHDRRPAVAGLLA